MIAFVKGVLIQASPLSVVIETAGIGYKISIPPSLFSKLPQIGEQVLVHTLLVIREFSQTLYGFHSIQEREVFEVLMGVTGIGPKLALSIIGHMTLSEMRKAFSQADLATLCRVPGIGKKTAERLVVEMRDKLNTLFPPDPSDLAISLPLNSAAAKIGDAMNALINLGYNQATAQKALKKTLNELSDKADLATLITSALKNV